MNGLEERVAKIEGIVGQMNERLNHFGENLISIRNEMNTLENSLRTEMNTLENSLRAEMKALENSLRTEMRTIENSLRREISSLRNWMFGILIPMWVTIILAIIFS